MRFKLNLDTLTVACVAIAGIVEAAQQALNSAPAVTTKFPSLLLTGGWNYVPLVLIGIATILWIVSQFIGDKSHHQPQQLVTEASLSLHLYGDARSATRISATHVWRWYYIHTAVLELDPQTNALHQRIVGGTLFVTFEPFVQVGTIAVSSPDMQLPPNEVKEFNNRFAVIVFSGPIPAGTVEIRVSN